MADKAPGVADKGPVAADKGPVAGVAAPAVGLAALLVILGVGVLLGGVVGFGPLAAATPPDQVTDPGEMLARSLQSTLDAFSVHLDGTLSGTLPGSVVDRPDPLLALNGSTITADLKPRDAKTMASLDSPRLGATLDAVTVWDGVWYRKEPGSPWSRESLGNLSAVAGLDANPLTMVDRIRAYVAASDRQPTVSDVPCAGVSGTCRHIVLDLGTDAAALFGALLSDEGDAAVAGVRTVLTLDTDARTLRPARLVLEMTSDDGTVDMQLLIDASRWDEPVQIEEPPAGS